MKNHSVIFRCGHCNFFPTQFQLQTYFLNADTFKCPVCNQLSSFLQNRFILMNTDYYIHQLQTISQQNCHIQKQNFLNSQIPLISLNTKTVFICIEKGQFMLQNFYLNPLNPEMRKSLNIKKDQILNQNKMVFFCINDNILRKLSLKSSQSYFNLRKVLKIQHLMYCLDLYIEALFTRLSQNGNQQLFQILLEIIDEKDSNLDTRRSLESKNLRQLKFTFESYKNFQSYYSRALQRIKNEQKIFQNQKFQLQVKKFLQGFYIQNSSQKDLNVGANELQDQKQIAQLKIFTLMSNKFNIDRMKSLLERKIKNLDFNKQKNQQKAFLVNNFHIECFHHKNNKDKNGANFVDSIHKTEVINKIFLSHSPMYIPHCEQSITLDNLINKLIDIFQQETPKISNLQTQSILKIENIYQTKSNINLTVKRKVKFQPKIKLNKRKTQAEQTQVEQKTIVYWKIIDQTESSEYEIKYKKITEKSLNLLLKLHISELLQNQSHKQMKPKIFQIEQQLLLILRLYEGEKISVKNIKLDRIFSESEGLSFFYVFSYESIKKQNFEELDFLDIYYLPQQLKGYSNTYQKAPPKLEKSFRKQNHRICQVDQEQQNSFKFQCQDQDLQTL